MKKSFETLFRPTNLGVRFTMTVMDERRTVLLSIEKAMQMLSGIEAQARNLRTAIVVAKNKSVKNKKDRH